jgi:hypothetical protein
MKSQISTIFLFSVVTLLGCSDKEAISKIPLIEKDTTKKLEKLNTLFCFVGEKIELKELKDESGEFDAAYLGTYKILERVYGHFDADTITFRAYSHRGFPEFGNFSTVLLYVSKKDTIYYHEKYQFNEVYKTTNNRWAGFSRDYYDQIDNASLIKAEKIEFKDFALPDTGNYVEDLFRLKKNGVLTYRGLFGDTAIVFKPAELELIPVKK